MNRRDLLLHEMHILQWELVKPQVFRGSTQIHLAKQIKLVVISDDNWANSHLFQDILRACNLNEKAFFWLTHEQILHLHFEHQPVFLFIKESEQAVRFSQQFANMTIWKFSSWEALQVSKKKRELWQFIQCAFYDDN